MKRAAEIFAIDESCSDSGFAEKVWRTHSETEPVFYLGWGGLPSAFFGDQDLEFLNLGADDELIERVGRALTAKRHQ